VRSEARAWLAEAWLAEGELAAAEQVLREALAEDATAVRAQVLLGRLLCERGDRVEARRELTAAAQTASSLAEKPRLSPRTRARQLRYLGLATRLLGRFHPANDAFRASDELDGTSADTRLEWAELYIDTHDLTRAAERVQAVLADNPAHARAQLLSARIAFASAGDSGTAQAALARALAVNPRLAAAHVLRASIALRDGDVTLADAALDEALAINPVEQEALATRAAVRFLEGDSEGFAEQERAALARNPHNGHFYSVVAEHAEWEHRYADVIALLQRALRIEPDNVAARASLGFGLLRTGDERAGLRALQKAWSRDRFNVQVYNTLHLYEVGIRRDYTEFTAGRFRVRLHKTERPVVEPYLVPLLERAYAQLQERWSFQPSAPLRVELYADRAQFSVRTTGLPDAGIQGVSFGKVITGLSPRGGPFNWGQIVWHELSHVFHLQLSNQRVPRWFTEGLAEYETALARPEWKREDDLALWQALRTDRLPPLSSMNRAFTQARTQDELMTGYFFAYRAVQYIVERFGFANVRQLLVAFGEGQKLEVSAPRVLGISLDELDRDFRRTLSEQLARFEHEFSPDMSSYEDASVLAARAARAPNDANLLAGLSLAELHAGHTDAAEQAASSSLKLAPTNRMAHFARARVAMARGDARTAERTLIGIVRSGADGYGLRMLLAHGAYDGGRLQAALAHAQAAVRFDGERIEAHKLLLELGAKLGDDKVVLEALRALAGLDQHDAGIHSAYLAMLVKHRAWADVIQEGETALYISPETPAIHLHLGEGYIEAGAYAAGLVELDRALALGYANPGLVRFVRARALLRQHNRAAALRELKAALAADPSLAQQARSLLTP